MKVIKVAGLVLGLVLFVASARADVLTVDAGWIAFCFAGNGAPATDTGCVDQPPGVGNPIDITVPGGGADLIVTDAFLHGAAFDVYEGGNLILSTPSVTVDNVSTCGPGSGFESDPNCAYADPLYSHGSVLLSAGLHTIDIFARISGYGGGEGFVQATSVPEPTTLALLASGLGALLLRRRRRS